MPLTKEGRGTGLAVAVDLINTWDALEAEPDLIEGLDDVRVWLTWHGLDRAAEAVSEADVAAMVVAGAAHSAAGTSKLSSFRRT